ncbi:MAG: CvpA family protein [Campylobacterales bacterium]|nr:CvpA family protein [Campylobacterales bacterium]
MDFILSDFNYFDVTIGAIVIILGIKGFINGFIKEIFGLIGLVAGVYFASRLAETAAKYIDQNFLHMENTSLLKLLGFLAILIIIWLGATIVGTIISKLTDASGLGFLNRLLGLIIGGGKYFIIFALIVTALSNVTLIKDNLEKYVKESVLYPYLKITGSYLINMDTSALGLTPSEITTQLPNHAEANETNLTVQTMTVNESNATTSDRNSTVLSH